MKILIGDLQQSTEHTVGYIEWLVEQIRKKSWIKLIILIDISIISFLNPKALAEFYVWIEGNKYLDQYPIPHDYWIYWIFVVTALFLIAILIAYRTRPKNSATSLAPGEDSAIKGLISFNFNDAKLFEKLGRARVIRDIGNAICEQDFRFGVLSGESGCGKSSLLQAGIWPYLVEKHHMVVYVQCNELQPLVSIKYAIHEQLNIPFDKLQELTLVKLLNFSAGYQNQTNTPKKLVLILDQFEQFFIQQRYKEDRKPFIEALRDWYYQEFSTIKVFISLRSDLTGRMTELQNALQYSLGPNQNFLLERFEPQEAANVFKTIIKQENIEYDDAFIEKLCKQELANQHDGLVSPVDLQILAWMITGKDLSERGRFDHATFLRLGGMDGLMNSFLNKILKTRETDERRQIVLKLLLALIDLDNNVRAGVLTEIELQQKLETSLTPHEISEALHWLIRPDVRLVTPRSKGEKQGFELAHERIIKVIRNMASKTLTDADLANQLLQRRVNEWLGNNYSPNYLFNLSELRQILKQGPYLAWQPNISQKKELIKVSKKKYFFRLYLAAGFILAGFSVYELSHLPQVQIWKVKQELLELKKIKIPFETQKRLTSAFLEAGMFDEAISIIDEFDDEPKKEEILRLLSVSATKLNNVDMATKLLSKIISATEKISNEWEKARILRSLTESAIKLNNTEMAIKLMNMIIGATEKISSEWFIAETLQSLSEGVTKLKNAEMSVVLMNKIIAAAEKIDGDLYKAQTLQSLSEEATKLGNADKAAELLGKAINAAEKIKNVVDQAKIFRSLADIAVKLNNTEEEIELLDKAINATMRITKTISQEESRAETFRLLSESSTTLKNNEKAIELLDLAISAAEKIGYEVNRAETLELLSESAVKLNNTKQAIKLLDGAIDAAAKISDDWKKASIFHSLSEIVVQLNETEKASELLSKLISAAESIGYQDNKAKTFQLLSVSVTKLKNVEKASELLVKIISAAEEIAYDKDRANAFQWLSESALKLDNNEKATQLRGKAINTAEKISDNKDRAKVLQLLSESAIKLNNPKMAIELLDKAISAALKINDNKNRAEVLQLLSESAAKLNNAGKELELLDKAVSAAGMIEYSPERASTLQFLSISAIRLNNTEKAAEILNKLINATAKIIQNHDGIKTLEQLMESAVKLNSVEKGRELFSKIQYLSNEIVYPENRNLVLIKLSEMAIKLGEWSKAIEIVNKEIDSESDKMEARIGIFRVWASMQSS